MRRKVRNSLKWKDEIYVNYFIQGWVDLVADKKMESRFESRLQIFKRNHPKGSVFFVLDNVCVTVHDHLDFIFTLLVVTTHMIRFFKNFIN